MITSSDEGCIHPRRDFIRVQPHWLLPPHLNHLFGSCRSEVCKKVFQRPGGIDNGEIVSTFLQKRDQLLNKMSLMIKGMEQAADLVDRDVDIRERVRHLFGHLLSKLGLLTKCC